MSFLGNLKKKITFKGTIKAVASVTKAIPIVGTAVGSIAGALDKAKENANTARSEVSNAGGAAGIIGNINQAAEDTSKMSKYLLFGGLALVAIVIFLVVRK